MLVLNKFLVLASCFSLRLLGFHFLITEPLRRYGEHKLGDGIGEPCQQRSEAVVLVQRQLAWQCEMSESRARGNVSWSGLTGSERSEEISRSGRRRKPRGRR